MKQEKKVWFIGYSNRLWVPVSLEGWCVMLAGMCAVGMIFIVHDVSDVPFVFSQHWPALVELALIAIATLWVSKGHVDKRY